MADTITDGRTLITANNAADPDLVVATTGTPDTGSSTETFIFGTASKPAKVSKDINGLLFDAGSHQDWSGQTFYIWYKCTSITDTQASGGVRFRFADDGGGSDPSVNFFEKYIAGGGVGSIDGWNMAVVNIDEARADAVAATLGGTNGTTPATTAIRYVGIVVDITGTVSGNTDNLFVDAMWRLPAATAGIVVQGQNGGSTPWTWQDIVDAGDVKDPTKAWGTSFKKDSIVTINTPIEFGANDAVTHDFSDSNVVVAWEDNLVDADFYELNIIGGSGSQNWSMGVKTGSGDAATGGQGLVMTAESAGVRYNIKANDANLDAANFYGCQFIHGGDFLFDNIATSVINPLFNDCSSALISNALDFQKGQVVNANTADGVAFITTDSLADIRDFTFDFSDGHAIEYTGSLASETLVGCVFNGYGVDTSNDAAIYISSGVAGTTTINVDFAITWRSPTRTIVVVLAPVTMKVTCKDANDSSLIEDAWVNVEAADGTGELFFEVVVTISASGTLATVAHTAHGLTTGAYVNIKDAVEIDYLGVQQITVTGVNEYTYVMANSPSSPATGTITSTEMIISGQTDVNGEIEASRTYSLDQPYRGFARKTDATPFYKTSNLSGTLDKAIGENLQAALVLDE